MSDTKQPVALAVTHHDPDGRLLDQTMRVLPLLVELFGGIAVNATHATAQRSLEPLRAAGAVVQQETHEQFAGYALLGRPRRAVLGLALRFNAPSLIFCDFDRVLHWAEFHPDELIDVIAEVQTRDFTVLGRTPRAYDSHPRVQRDTEILFNQLFAQISGQAWDIGAGARGMSRRAAEALLAGCHDESVGNDGSWPLFLLRAGGFAVGHRATEGLEFETADRYADQIAAASGLRAWIDRMDADPRNWVQRLEIARAEIESLVPYAAH